MIDEKRILGNGEEDFEVFYWKNQKRYRCNLSWESGAKCSYDTHDLALMNEHRNVPHTFDGKPKEAPKKMTVKSKILDENGDPFQKEIPAEFQGARFKRES